MPLKPKKDQKYHLKFKNNQNTPSKPSKINRIPIEPKKELNALKT